MADAQRLRPLPWRRHLNWLVLAGLVSTLAIPVGSVLAEYEGEPWLNLISLATAATAFTLLACGLGLGPTKDARRVARRGIPASATVEQAVSSNISLGSDDGPTQAKMVRLDLRVEAEGEPPVRVRLRRWVHVDRLPGLQPGVVLPATILAGRPQDPALGLRRSPPPG